VFFKVEENIFLENAPGYLLRCKMGGERERLHKSFLFPITSINKEIEDLWQMKLAFSKQNGARKS
jgi:hypothetical protein